MAYQQIFQYYLPLSSPYSSPMHSQYELCYCRQLFTQSLPFLLQTTPDQSIVKTIYNHHHSSSLHSLLYFTTKKFQGETNLQQKGASLILSCGKYYKYSSKVCYKFISLMHIKLFILTAVLWRRAAVSLYLSLGMEQVL